MRLATKPLILAAAVAGMAAATSAVPQAAQAGMHGRHVHMAHMHKAKVRLVPAHLKPGYVGMPGYAGGPPGKAPPMLVDIPAVPAGGGLLGAGLVPSTGVFAGVPVLGAFGL